MFKYIYLSLCPYLPSFCSHSVRLLYEDKQQAIFSPDKEVPVLINGFALQG